MKIRFALMMVFFSTALWAAEPLAPNGSNSAFEKMRSLIGSWEGVAKIDGRDLPKAARFQMVAGSTVLAAWLNEGTPHEMVTMFHMDGNDLMATHYCAAQNQPRMVLASGSDPNRLVFKFKDGTNIQSDSGYMQEVTFIFDGARHHSEEWTFVQNGKAETTRFDFTRKQ